MFEKKSAAEIALLLDGGRMEAAQLKNALIALCLHVAELEERVNELESFKETEELQGYYRQKCRDLNLGHGG